MIGALVALVFARLGRWSLSKQAVTSVFLSAAILGIVYLDSILLAILAFAMFELCLNTLSPLFNGRLAACLDAYWKHWIGITAFSGALAGPPIAAGLVEREMAGGPAIPAIASLVMAFAWASASWVRNDAQPA